MSEKLPQIDLNEYRYNLPESRIPDKPLDQRDASKLLVYQRKAISEDIFYNLSKHLPESSLLVFNNSRVFPARLHFVSPTGQQIEVFCLKQLGNWVFDADKRSAKWECMVGNARKWKDGIKLGLDIKSSEALIHLQAEKLENLGGTFVIDFHWDATCNFFELLELIGELPLPPYMNRKADASDKLRYQTVYADPEGSVAAPTAGLHFTNEVFESLKLKNIHRDFLTLHVGAGTFKPIKTDDIRAHIMHNEQFVVKKSLLQLLIDTPFIVSVGTTSTRVLESLYHVGVKLLQTGEYEDNVKQWSGFEIDSSISKQEALTAIIQYMEKQKLEEISGSTEIFIVPGYRFKVINALVTNFHQPESTLVLLVAALLGEDWKKVYQYALDNEFRFLSYGDSSLLIP